MKTTDVSKLSLVIFERIYNGPYLCHFLWLLPVSIKCNDWGCYYSIPYVKKIPKKPNQKWIKCCMKAPIRYVLSQASLLMAQFSKRYMKTVCKIL